jgi:hypothetical protein
MTTHIDLRTVPVLPWPRILLAAIVVAVLGVAAWELTCRARGYRAGLDDTSDLWVDARRSLQPDGIAIVGSSRGLFGLDLGILGEGLGTRPTQLCLVGSSPAPVLMHLAADRSFHGTVILDLVPGMVPMPAEAPPYQNAMRAVRRHERQSWAEWASHRLSLPLERTFAFLQQEDLTLAILLKGIRVPDRERTKLPPDLPPAFYTIEADRQARMEDRVETDQALRERIRTGWAPLFTPPPKPVWIPDAAFGPAMGRMVEQRVGEIVQAISDIRARGGRVVLLRMPSTGDLRVLEERITPRAPFWDRILQMSGVQGVWFEDHPDLASFPCPEESHLSAADSVEFSRRLVPHLRQALVVRKD